MHLLQPFPDQAGQGQDQAGHPQQDHPLEEGRDPVYSPEKPHQLVARVTEEKQYRAHQKPIAHFEHVYLPKPG
ncbi:hypothetical protein DRJ54_06830 [Candidatus Acetothermia bacterium]|nr:MAG: hypothetical protein DRJ54_06830 [Candidatus Acetothermia bacterium]